MKESILIRPVDPSDIDACGRVLYYSFKGIADQHGFRPEMDSLAQATRTAASCVYQSTTEGLAAEREGRILGSTFMDMRDPIFGIGPVSVDEECQGMGIGRMLMEEVLKSGKDALGIRLVQDTFNVQSLALYVSLGFEVKEPLAFIEGQFEIEPPKGVKVRRMKTKDLDQCAQLCRNIHGVDRTSELVDAMVHDTAYVLINNKRITACTSAVAYWGHGLAETEQDMQALILGVGAQVREPISFIIPIRQHNFFGWCLENGLRMVKPMTLMARGFYQDPQGFFFTSATY